MPFTWTPHSGSCTKSLKAMERCDQYFTDCAEKTLDETAECPGIVAYGSFNGAGHTHTSAHDLSCDQGPLFWCADLLWLLPYQHALPSPLLKAGPS
jgi:hypothetical protein